MALMKGVSVGGAVAVGLAGVGEVGDGVTGVVEAVMEGNSVALGVGLDGGITSRFLSIALPGMTRSRYVEAISTWTG